MLTELITHSEIAPGDPLFSHPIDASRRSDGMVSPEGVPSQFFLSPIIFSQRHLNSTRIG
jgi:hypothetical protein